MGAFEVILGVVLALASTIIIVTVTLQETKGGLGSMYGGAGGDSFFDKNMNRTREATLLRATKFAGICLFVVTVVLGFVVAR